MARHVVDARSAAALIVASGCWGVATVICKSLLSSVTPLTLLVIQLAPSVVLLWLVILLTRVPIPRLSDCVRSAMLGILNPGISYTLSLMGLRRTSASISSLLWAAEPVFIVILSWLLLRERPSLRLLGITACGALGVALVAGEGQDESRVSASLSGCALILAGVVFCAFYTIAARKFVTLARPLVTVALQQLVGLLCALVLWHFDVGGTWYDNLQSTTKPELAWGTVSGVMYYAVAFWLYLRALATVPANIAGLFLNLIPMFGVGTAFMFLDETLTDVQWFGALAILTSVWALLSAKAEQKALGAV